jgi:anti-anti-sigma regulatory factor
MRRVVQSPSGRTPGDHLCWPFRGHAELTAVARPYVAEGLDRGERVVYVGEGGPDELKRDLHGVLDLDGYLARGQLQLEPVEAMPTSGPSPSPATELTMLATMTAQAVDAGYSGLRMFSNGTTRALDPGRRAQHVGYEHLVDRFCLEHAFTFLCAYDAAALGNSAVAELACVHALTHGNLSPFQVHAARTVDAALAGSVDVFSATQLEEALLRIGLGASGGKVIIDATELTFIDIRGLLALDRHAAATDATVVLRSPPAPVRRLLTLVDLIAMQVEDRP